VKRALLFLLLGTAVSCGVFRHEAPTGQPPLASMDLATLRADFNRTADRTRLILLVSPT
jgi:hypothetical protein